MKQFLLSLILTYAFFSANAQDTSRFSAPPPKTPLPTDYIGVGTGINSNVGIVGITYEHIFKEHIGTYVNLGIGGWGAKMGIGGRLYFRDALSGAVGINYSYVGGAKGVKSSLDVVENGKTVNKEIEFDAHPVNTLNISYLKFWRMGKRSRFNLELGYSVALNGKSEANYTLKTPGVILTETSTKALNFTQPGGLIIAVGFTFGL
jgi:hypothetical protein